MNKRIFKGIAWTLGIVLILIIGTLTTVDNSDYRQEQYYIQTLNRIQDLEFSKSDNDYWLAGWATANITPAEPVNLVGYKPRGKYEFIQDSSYVKTLVISNGLHTVAFLSYELLIIHPYLANEVEQAIANESLPIDRVVFTATHTHSGLGGYIPGIMGKVAFGGFEEDVISLFTHKTISGLRNALASLDTVTITYLKKAAPEGVANRLVDKGPIDPYIRQLIFEKKDKSKATFHTYSAHATGLHSRFMGLSGDYPFYLNEALNREGYDFTFFASGAVGSHRPELAGREVGDILSYAESLNATLKATDPIIQDTLQASFKSGTFRLSLPSPHFRISDQIRFRPWLFNWIYGDTNAHFDLVLMGNTLIITSSGEVSGVFYDEWEQKAAELGLNLIITTFNGGYIGYITPDEHYGLKHHEVRDTHWFGPQVGRYYNDIISHIISKAAERN
ncbi:MAG TPA: neutral/alkaline non-lysosomal ceramidase N-terminal domain-containing protein [Anditalea sp.]|nr:neutral/alkaline non-lysosomal ceramidase N-terminal domain-containing protein [Anditalea sp.]